MKSKQGGFAAAHMSKFLIIRQINPDNLQKHFNRLINLSGMKFQLRFLVASLAVIALCANCKNDSPASSKIADESANTAASTGQMATAPVAPTNIQAPNPAEAPTTEVKKPEPPQNAKGVWHYTCAKGCAGGAGAAQPCAKCGATLAHNNAYHQDAAASTPSTPTSGAISKPADAPKPEPAQNAKGVWHYTCPDACPGGAGSATACAKCGKTLAHNQVYHQ